MIAVLVAATVLTLSAAWLTLISGLVIPLLTGLVTKLEASKGLKGLITLVLAALAGILQSVVGSDGVLTTDTLLNAAVTWGLSLGAFYGIWSPANADAKLVPTKGLG